MRSTGPNPAVLLCGFLTLFRTSAAFASPSHSSHIQARNDATDSSRQQQQQQQQSQPQDRPRRTESTDDLVKRAVVTAQDQDDEQKPTDKNGKGAETASTDESKMADRHNEGAKDSPSNPADKSSRPSAEANTKSNETTAAVPNCKYNATGTITLPDFYNQNPLVVGISVSESLSSALDAYNEKTSLTNGTTQRAPSDDDPFDTSVDTTKMKKPDQTDLISDVSQQLHILSPGAAIKSGDGAPFRGCVAVLADAASQKPASAFPNSDEDSRSCSGVLPPDCVRDLLRQSEDYAKKNAGESDDDNSKTSGRWCRGIRVPVSCPYALEIAVASIGNSDFVPELYLDGSNPKPANKDEKKKSKSRTTESCPNSSLFETKPGSSKQAEYSRIPQENTINAPILFVQSDPFKKKEGNSANVHNARTETYDGVVKAAVPVVVMAWSKKDAKRKWHNSRVVCVTASDIANGSREPDWESASVPSHLTISFLYLMLTLITGYVLV